MLWTGGTIIFPSNKFATCQERPGQEDDTTTHSQHKDSTKRNYISSTSSLLPSLPNSSNLESDIYIPGLADYSLSEIQKHTSPEVGFWVHYHCGVYDISKFVDHHPGGKERLLLAAGGSLEPYWQIYSVHNQQPIYHMLEKFRIGNFKPTPDEVVAMQQHRTNKDISSDLYKFESNRHPALSVVSERPFNAETPCMLLVDNFITPNHLFFIRNHLAVPDVPSDDDYRLTISGLGLERAVVTLSLAELKSRFPKEDVTMTIQCAGNRRNAFTPFKPVKGLDWQLGAIGTAVWSGCRLSNVLAAYGIDVARAEMLGINHVQFEGMDTDLSSQSYGASIPATKALMKDGDVLLAYEMNGVPIPADHGPPLRAIVPGVVGARNVKWLNRIVLSEEESPSFWQQQDYKVFSPAVDWSNVDWRRAPAIQEYPVQSGICEPMDGSVLEPSQDSITVNGYAWSGGGRAIVRVDVSLDGGLSWHEARLRSGTQRASGYDAISDSDDDEQDGVDWRNKQVDKAWAWVLWTADIDIPEELRNKKLEICSRAVDASYNVQPESAGPLWNIRGCLCNAWHRVTISASAA